MRHPVQKRQYARAIAHRRRDRGDGVVEIVGLAGENNDVEWRLARELRLGHSVDRSLEVAASRAFDDETVLGERRLAGVAHEEGDVRAALHQSATEIAADSAGA